MVKYPSSLDNYTKDSSSSDVGTEATLRNTNCKVTTVPTGRYRQYKFTDYNTDPLVFDSATMKYLIYGKEVGSKTEREHWQGHVWFNNARHFGGAKKIITNGRPKPVHVSVSNYPEYSAKYCAKDGNFVEFGTRPAQGQRSDIVGSIMSGKTNSEIIKIHGDQARWLYKAIDWARTQLNDCKRDWVMDVRIYWGESGTGKSRAVWDEFGEENVFPKMVGKWWDGYRGEHCVLIDNFNPVNCLDTTYQMYIKLLDRYPMYVECKGSSFNFRSKTIIFTSKFDPDCWFRDKSNRATFFRRVTEIKKFK